MIPEFCGHGIGSYFHGPPDIIHIGMLYASVIVFVVDMNSSQERLRMNFHLSDVGSYLIDFCL